MSMAVCADAFDCADIGARLIRIGKAKILSPRLRGEVRLVNGCCSQDPGLRANVAIG